MGQLKLHASSLIESIMATIIIVLSFGIGMLIFMNILSSEQVFAKAKADAVLHALLEETKQKKSYLTEVFEKDGLKITKSMTRYDNLEDTFILELTAFSNQEKLHSIQEIIYYPQ